jgi:8-oxo-dGTP pyrophosphatase MutT (NUDIX family)
MPDPSPLPAATVTLVRDCPRGLEVLLLQRSFDAGFMPGVHVFPGGGLDPDDASRELQALCCGPGDAGASRLLGVERGGLAYWVAAIREAFEEAGVLLAYAADGALLELRGATAARFRAHREALDRGERSLAAILREEGLRLATDRLLYFSHWITPLGLPRRYDTRFFLARAPEAQEPSPDQRETIAHAWVRPAEALERHARGEINLRTPTLRTLELFARHEHTGGLEAALRAQRGIPALLPRLTADGRGLLPGEPGYEEAADPKEEG